MASHVTQADLKSPASGLQQGDGSLDAAHRAGQRVFITTRESIDVIGCRTMDAADSWLRRHGIVRRQNGTVSRLDIERELKRKSRRGRSANSRANLRLGTAASL